MQSPGEYFLSLQVVNGPKFVRVHLFLLHASQEKVMRRGCVWQLCQQDVSEITVFKKLGPRVQLCTDVPW